MSSLLENIKYYILENPTILILAIGIPIGLFLGYILESFRDINFLAAGLFLGVPVALFLRKGSEKEDNVVIMAGTTALVFIVYLTAVVCNKYGVISPQALILFTIFIAFNVVANKLFKRYYLYS